MNQLEIIRRERHIDYKLKTWFPYFTEKYSKYFTKQYKAAKRIGKFLKDNLFKNVINDDEMIYIPGIYRLRIQLDNNNLNKPIKMNKPTIKNKESIFTIDDDIKLAIDRSLSDFEITNKYDMEDNLEYYVDYDEYLINEIILESHKIENISFYFCIDLRVYGRNPYEQICIDGRKYYLSDEQIKKVISEWNKVNPETSRGLQFTQNLEYYKSLSNDINKYI